MNDLERKKWIAALLDERELLFRCSSYFNSSDIRQGILPLSQDLLNVELYPMILAKAMPYVQRYEISFSQNMIFVELDLNLKQLGPVKAFYMLQVTDFRFEPNGHRVTLTFREDVKSTGNAMQAMMFKTAKSLLSGSFLEKAVTMAKISGIYVQGDTITIDLDQLPVTDGVKNMYDYVTLAYVRAEDKKLVFRFSFA